VADIDAIRARVREATDTIVEMAWDFHASTCPYSGEWDCDYKPDPACPVCRAIAMPSDLLAEVDRLNALVKVCEGEIGSCKRNAATNPKWAGALACQSCSATKTCAALAAIRGEA
jgi:hypothetical protein